MPKTELLSKLCPSRSTTNQGGKARLTVGQRICYGVGHIFNDLCANCWFSYLLIYMTKVVGLSNSNAGIVLLIGQVADAIFTPFIGYGCDKTNWKRYGRRKLWHAIGTISVIASFPFVFNLCIRCKNESELIKLIYYSGFVIVFQFGWAAVQISHLSLIPEIACKVSEKVELNAIRSGLTFVCGIFVFGVNWGLLGANSEESVTPAVATQFAYLTIVVVITGSVFSLIFHIGTVEPKQPCNTPSNGCVKKKECIKQMLSPQTLKKVPLCIEPSEGSEAASDEQTAGQHEEEESLVIMVDRKNCQERCKTWKEWFKSSLFYKMAVVYMCTRLTVNVSQSYLVLYLTDTLAFEKEAIAYFPLMVLVSGVLASFSIKIMNKKIGSKFTYIVGCMLSIGACAWFFVLSRVSHKSVYAAAVLMGAGTSIMLVTSLAMTADLIGSHKSSGAFVYAAMSFTDKLSSGIVIAVIQAMKPESVGKEFCPPCAEFTKYVQAAVPGSSAILALLCVALFFPAEFILKKKACYKDAVTQTEQTTDEVDGLDAKIELQALEPCRSTEFDGSVDGCDLESSQDQQEIDDKLKRLSWHSAMTSYVAWRLASPHLPSPVVERRCPCPESEAV